MKQNIVKFLILIVQAILLNWGWRLTFGMLNQPSDLMVVLGLMGFVVMAFATVNCVIGWLPVAFRNRINRLMKNVQGEQQQ